MFTVKRQAKTCRPDMPPVFRSAISRCSFLISCANRSRSDGDMILSLSHSSGLLTGRTRPVRSVRSSGIVSLYSNVNILLQKKILFSRFHQKEVIYHGFGIFSNENQWIPFSDLERIPLLRWNRSAVVTQMGTVTSYSAITAKKLSNIICRT